ncbi:hypothetical protein C8Q76DRAFT_790598 [Earliella scabrosa]|nr:hypothetical protein C8Q76DRAFT_790598 [Earliella scabrosa]
MTYWHVHKINHMHLMIRLGTQPLANFVTSYLAAVLDANWNMIDEVRVPIGHYPVANPATQDVDVESTSRQE